MIILTTSYNIEKYAYYSINSIKHQSLFDFRCFITDDLSTDNSRSLVKDLIKDDNRFKLIENAKKMYQPGNYNQIIRGDYNISDNEIIVEVDGDDWLPDPNVLARINDVYSNNDVWIANGSFIYNTGAHGFSSPQTNFDNLRTSRFTASHIRTWRAFLWREINENDLKDENGEYWRMTGDLAFMFPMLEMAGPEHYKFMPEVNYVYNADNPLNDHKVDITLVDSIAKKIRTKPKYNRL
jgi:glycosyltransferase involved in cell wall biosynthesis